MSKHKFEKAVSWRRYNALVKKSKSTPPQASDMLHNSLSNGDYVIYTDQRDSEIYISRVVKVGPKSSMIKNFWGSTSRKTNIYMLKIDPPKDFEIDIS